MTARWIPDSGGGAAASRQRWQLPDSDGGAADPDFLTAFGRRLPPYVRICSRSPTLSSTFRRHSHLVPLLSRSSFHDEVPGTGNVESFLVPSY
jgi:hypothetical protein